MTTWWFENHPRLTAEKACIVSLKKRAAWLENVEWSFDDSLRMRVVFDIRLDHGVFPLVMTYHNTFPSSPPGVTPVEKQRLSSHQYGCGDLCLEIRPDNWRQEFTGADMIESAYSLLVTEAPDENGNSQHAPSAHNVPDTITLRSATFRFYVTPEVNQVLTKDAPGLATAKIWVQWTGSSFAVAHLASLKLDEWSWEAKLTPPALEHESFAQMGMMLRTKKKDSDFTTVKNVEELVDVLGYDPGFSEQKRFCLVVTSDDEFIIFLKISDTENLCRYRTIYSPTQSVRRSGEEFSDISVQRVGIVGTGSLGAKVAVTLARASVHHFELIDDDILHYGNLERHDADWRDVGVHKVDAVSRRLKLIAKGVEVNVRRMSIGAQVSTTEAANVNAALDNCDLIVDATANPHVFNHLSGLVLRSDKTLMWGGIYAGGIGGYIARSRPKRDPDPFMIREGINQYYLGIDIPPPVPDDEGYDGRDENTILIASDADISVIAAHLANFSLDALLEREPSTFEHHAYIIGLKRAWDFDAAFDVQPISVNAAPRSMLPQQEHDPLEKKFTDKLIAKKLNEIENRKKSD